MSCTPCQSTKPIITCTKLLTVGAIAQNSHPVYVWLFNKTTGKIDRFEETSDVNGLVVVDLSGVDLSENQLYEIFVTNRNAWIGDKLPVTVGGDAYNCFTVYFKQTNAEPADQTLTI
jgi:hypothetical protein